MRKILLILLAFASFTLSAQNEQMREMMSTTQNTREVRDVSASSIRFWVGEGSKQVLASFFFCADEPIGIAYGYRFDGSATIHDMLSAINDADENFFCELTSWINSVSYNDGEHDCLIESGMLMYTVNGGYSSGFSDPLYDGDYFELRECGGGCTLPTDNIFYPEDPNASTEVDATISADQIQYWVGEGENEAIFIVQWCEPETALAWGYRFDGEATVEMMMNDITADDSRLTYDGDASVVNQINYNDEDYSLSLTGWGWMYNMNGWMAHLGYTSHTITNGDVVKWGDAGCAIEVGDISDWENFTYIWTTEVTPVSNPNGGEEVVDATIPADQIIYWVGEGANEVVVAISWCSNTETALAWGYRFDGEATVFDALTAIATDDDRLTVVGSAPSNVTYVDDQYDLTMCPNPDASWGDADYDTPMHSVNGLMGQNAMAAEPIQNNDFIKIGGYACGIMSDDWSQISWTTTIIPATNPNEDTTVVVEDATISADQIVYWVGEGSNEVVVAISWCSNTETALAWGYRFDGEATVFDALTAIATDDDRLTVVGSAPSNVTYVDDQYNLTMCPNPDASWGDDDYDTPMHSVNGLMGQNAMAAEPIQNNDFIKIGGYACGIMSDDWSQISWTTAIIPATNPNEDTTVVVEDATISADQIIYWVGEGSNEVVVAISWCSNTETALAWGYRFDGEATVFDALTAIATDDDRLTVVGSAPSNVTYVDDQYDLTMCPNPDASWGDADYDTPMHSVNGLMGQNAMAAEPIQNNDFIKIGGYACGIMSDDWSQISWTTAIIPATNPNEDTTVVVEDATISADQIVYWVGEGSNEVVVAISWCSNTETALAWGYRFDGEATVFDALTAIATDDDRLTVVGSAPSNVTYVDDQYDLTMCPNPDASWGDADYDTPMHSVNGLMGQNAMAAEPIQNNDFIKIGGYACGIMSDDWSQISWTTAIIPATNPNEVGPDTTTFDGPVGEDDCQGIHCENPAILGWATTCTIERGPQDITVPGVYASYGSDSDGIGAATESTTAGVVSLGDGGTAVLTFDVPIQNGDGYDFAVFENALNNTFLELAFVEVSSDGVNYVRFPAISNTPTDVQVNNGGSVNARLLNNLAGKHRAGWGTPFDLDEIADDPTIDVNNITHIRLVDVVGTVDPLYATRDSRGHIINDPYPTPYASSGFDLSGVCVLNGWSPNKIEDSYMVSNHALHVYPNPCNTQITVEANIGEPVMLFNSVGTLVYRTTADDVNIILNVSDYPAGLYILKCGDRTARIVKM